MPQPQPGSRAFQSAQMMADFRRIEEMSKRPKGQRVTADDIIFLNAFLTRLPPNTQHIRAAIESIKKRYVRNT